MDITEKLTEGYKGDLKELYGSEDAYSLFERSYLKFFSVEDGKVTGAVRIISEGVETALLVDLKANCYNTKAALLKTAEKQLNDRRVMAYGSFVDLSLFEELGYGRCKNAWTYFREGLDEEDFLPAGFRYENEFIPVQRVKDSDAVLGEQALRKSDSGISYKNDIKDTDYPEINGLLTRAFFGHPHDVKKTEAAFNGSTYSVSAYDGEKLVGVARAVTDAGNEGGKEIYGKYATILNVAVDPAYQGLHIGKTLVLNISRIIPAEIIVLNTHAGAAGFYNKIREYRRNLYVFEKHVHEGEQREMPPERRIGMFTPKGFRFPKEYDC